MTALPASGSLSPNWLPLPASVEADELSPTVNLNCQGQLIFQGGLPSSEEKVRWGGWWAESGGERERQERKEEWQVVIGM